MVPIVGKPCMEHILELLHKHGFDDVIVTLAFLPQAIRSYFGDGDALGLNVEYSVEESPLGTAGSVREDTLPRINALAEQVERDSQRVGRLALQLDRDPQSLLFGKKPAARPGPGEPGFK
jgi:CRISPR/Cas system-associated exonuclease Cas4 (RecB family)